MSTIVARKCHGRLRKHSTEDAEDMPENLLVIHGLDCMVDGNQCVRVAHLRQQSRVQEVCAFTEGAFTRRLPHFQMCAFTKAASKISFNTT